MDERKKSSIEKEKDHEVNNRMAERKKVPYKTRKYPGTEVNNRMDKKKVQYRTDEVKNRADERTNERKKKKSTSL